MRFNTHDQTPRRQSSKQLKILLAVSLSFVGACLLFFAVVCSYYAKSILPALIILLAIGIPSALLFVMNRDMNMAYVEIMGGEIRVVDLYFGIKKENKFLVSDIKTAESYWGGSLRIKGYRWRFGGMHYIVFRDGDGKYLFKILDLPETRDVFGAFVEITMG